MTAQDQSPRPTFSIVIPVYNEQDTLQHLYRRLTQVMVQLDGATEVILVDDGSSDDSFVVMARISDVDPRFKVVQLSRNFGHQVAISAGCDYAAGDAVIIMDADLQDPPELIPELVARWREGYEVVYAVRRRRVGEKHWKLSASYLFYRFFNRIGDVEAPSDTGDFRLLDRRAVDALKAMPERNRYVRGMVSWIGFRQTGVTYDRPARIAGETKYPLRKQLKLALDGTVSFSDVPLRLMLGIGFAFAAFSFVGGLTAIGLKVSGVFTVPGWASLVVIIFFLMGVQLLVLGVIGQYLARVYEEVKRRPLYVVREVKGLSRDAVEARIGMLERDEMIP